MRKGYTIYVSPLNRTGVLNPGSIVSRLHAQEVNMAPGRQPLIPDDFFIKKDFQIRFILKFCLLTIIGGLIQAQRGAVGTFSGGSKASGFSKNYIYDHRCTTAAPPWFPPTGLMDVIFWHEHP